MSGGDPDTIEDEIDSRLQDVLEYYDSEDMLPYAHYILFLSGVKESLGILPHEWNVTWLDLILLNVLREENSKKMMYDSQESRRKAQA